MNYDRNAHHQLQRTIIPIHQTYHRTKRIPPQLRHHNTHNRLLQGRNLSRNMETENKIHLLREQSTGISAQTRRSQETERRKKDEEEITETKQDQEKSRKSTAQPTEM